MTVKSLILPGAYYDSVVLMRVAAKLNAMAGVEMASLNMATPANLEVLDAAGLLTSDASSASPNDLIIAVNGDDDVIEGAYELAQAELEQGLSPGDGDGGLQPVTLRTIAQSEGANMALISTPGTYAGAEALKALHSGMNVFLFSDNVSLEQEIQLKRTAHDLGLIVMGPDCGTTIIGGVPLGFANVVRDGEIGLVAASGTGLQEVSTLIDNWGGGVSHAIGVGGRDLSKDVGAISMHDAIDALGQDPGTKVIGLISKPPDPEVADKVLRHAAATGKPVVAAFLGADPVGAPDGVTIVPTLEGAAAKLVEVLTGSAPELPTDDAVPEAKWGERRLLRALFAGGTFAYEAVLLLEPEIGHIEEHIRLKGLHEVHFPDTHVVVDLGDDAYTVGRAHPMIDPTVRIEVLRAAGNDPSTAIILLDVVLGYMADEDPAGSLADAITEITSRKDAPVVLAFVSGTEADPQGLSRQQEKLRRAGAVVAHSSTAAARLISERLK